MVTSAKKIGSHYIFSVCGLEVGRGRGIDPWRKGAIKVWYGTRRPGKHQSDRWLDDRRRRSGAAAQQHFLTPTSSELILHERRASSQATSRQQARRQAKRCKHHRVQNSSITKHFQHQLFCGLYYKSKSAILKSLERNI